MSFYDMVYITNLPSFYKINLFNRISKKRKLIVIFIDDTASERNDDFYKGERDFEHISLGRYSGIVKVIKLIFLLYKLQYEKVILGGWDSKELWLAAWLNPRKKNCLVIESSILESTTIGFKGFVKRLFFRKISTVYASGKSQAQLAATLGFKGNVKITKGVGVFNIIESPPYFSIQKVANFIYVGRLSKEKNLEFLIKTFNKLPHLNLNIVGYGPLEYELKLIAHRNINFYGAISNKELPSYYQSSHVFILPSLSEPWGLVVEEALNNGIPVIVSDKVGCAAEIVKSNINGIVFSLSDPEGLKAAILKMEDISYYNSLKKNVCRMDFKKIIDEQVDCYL